VLAGLGGQLRARAGVFLEAEPASSFSLREKVHNTLSFGEEGALDIIWFK